MRRAVLLSLLLLPLPAAAQYPAEGGSQERAVLVAYILSLR